MSTIKTLIAAANLCESHGITVTDLVTMALIDGLQPVTLTNLATAAGVCNPAITGRADKLEEAGLVTRIRRKSDRRKIDLVLTKRGRGTLDDFQIASNNQ